MRTAKASAGIPSLYGYCADVVYPRCHNPNTGRRGGSRSRRRPDSEVSVSHPHWSGPDTIPGTAKKYLIPQTGRIREPPLPELAGMMAPCAGRSRHSGPSCRLEIPFTSRYLEFVCVQVRVSLGDPAHRARAAPGRGPLGADATAPRAPDPPRGPDPPQKPARENPAQRTLGINRRCNRPMADPAGPQQLRRRGARTRLTSPAGSTVRWSRCG